MDQKVPKCFIFCVFLILAGVEVWLMLGGRSHLLVGDFRILGYSNEAILIALQQHQGVKAFPL